MALHLSHIKKILLIALLASVVSYNPGAVEKNHNVAEKLVPGNVRITNDYSSGWKFAAAEKSVRSFMRKWSITGASVAVAKNGKLIYARGFGYTDTISKEEVQPYHKFRIASISKLVTAVAIMKLAEEDKLSLNDTVFGPNGILNDPYFSNPKDKRVFRITVAYLLSHAAGGSRSYGDETSCGYKDNCTLCT
jgi:CubicO group peptidase (beta-lactamase class C family)